MKVLIAEDDITFRIMLESALKKWGFIPVVTCDGKEALDVMQSEEAPKLAILDWQMPKMSGIEVCQKIRELDTSDPAYLIVLTVRDDKKDVVKALDTGANDFISKPYDIEELRARVNVGKRMVELQSALKVAYMALEHEAMHDPLTGIYNRRAIMNLLEKEMARAKREKTSLCIGLCDLDHFKKVNDTYGHQVGDKVLTSFARRVTNRLRSNDHMGRYGGEEFLILAPGPRGKKQDNMFKRICEYVRNDKIVVKKENINITVSIGMARYSGSENSDTLLAHADTALYHAKRIGRDCAVSAEDI